MPRKKKHGEGHIDETWLIPYADLLTLLLALFIVLFASSNLQEDKYEAMMESLYQAFNGVMPAHDTKGVPLVSGGGGSEQAPIVMPAPPVMPPDLAQTEKPDPMKGLYDSVEKYVEDNRLSSEMKLNLSDKGLLITLTSDVWFASGSAAVTDRMKSVAANLAQVIAKSDVAKREDLMVMVSGHTDNQPITGSQFRSNWHLSVERAVNFMETILNASGKDGQFVLDPRKFGAQGYGEYEPVATNATPEGRQKNRRVEVLISLLADRYKAASGDLPGE